MFRVTRKSLGIAILIATVFSLLAAPAASANTGSISGIAFRDLNGDGVKQAAEEPLANQTIYLHTLSPYAIVAGVTTDASGAYSFSGLTSDGYRVSYEMNSWSALWADWTPTTTGSARPRVEVQLSGSATVNFGWRPITRSTDVQAPISVFTGSNGLRVESFNDVVPAKHIYDAVMRGLVGPEASSTTVRFDFGATSSTTAGFAGGPGNFSNFSAVSYNDWITWLRYGDYGIAHEHGHVWAAYHEHIVQQDGDFSGYLAARGLTGDSRVGTSYIWEVGELIAEDYRILFGSPEAAARPHMNSNIPAPRDVAGLETYLRDTFTTAPASAPAKQTAPAPDTTAPGAPANLTATAGKGSAALSWTAATDQGGSGVAGYEVWRKSGRTSFVKVATVTDTKFTDTGLKRGTVYTYYVTAVDGAGNIGSGSNQASAKAL